MLGAKRKSLAGLSSSSAQPHQGFIFACDLIQGTPPGMRSRAARLVGAKSALLARVDAFGQDPTGQTGTRFKVSASANDDLQRSSHSSKVMCVLQLGLLRV